LSSFFLAPVAQLYRRRGSFKDTGGAMRSWTRTVATEVALTLFWLVVFLVVALI
jgi:hypothetical protein